MDMKEEITNEKVYVKPKKFDDNFLLTIITCGLWKIYWDYRIINNTQTIIKQKVTKTEFWKFFGLNIISLGLYKYYWYYKVGNPNEDLNKNKDLRFKFLSLLILQLLLGTLNRCLKVWNIYMGLSLFTITLIIIDIVNIIIDFRITYIMQENINDYVNRNFKKNIKKEILV